MKPANVVILAIIVVLFAACAASKKNRVTKAAPAPVVAAVPPAAPITKLPDPPTSSVLNPYLFSKPADGIYAPGSEELNAIEPQYKGLTIDRLKAGYVLYAQGACTNCHHAKPIYPIKTSDWAGIIDDMAGKAMLTDVQKDAVYMYVMSIKATQPK